MANLTTNTIPKATGAAQIDDSSIVDSGGVVVGSPTGGAKGAGTVNATGLYSNGTAVPLPSNANLLGGNGTAFTSVTVGTGLTLSAGTLGWGKGTDTAVAGAATVNALAGKVVSEALTGATSYTLTLTNSRIAATSIILVSIINSDGTACFLKSITPGSGSASIVVGTVAVTGTVTISFAVFN